MWLLVRDGGETEKVMHSVDTRLPWEDAHSLAFIPFAGALVHFR